MAAAVVAAGAVAATRGSESSSVPRLGRVVVVVFENKDRDMVLGDPAAPTFAALSRRYAKKHDPFLYFRRVLAIPARRRHVVPYSVFQRDLASGSLPDYSLVVPNLCNDMHDCSVATGDRWLARFIAPVLTSPQLRGGVVFVVFDEGENSHVGGGGNVPALVLGPLVRPDVRSAKVIDHYGLLRTIEDGLGLPRLGRSANARPITGIWKTPTS